MCRLFAFVAPKESSASGQLGDDGIDSFLSLARLHGDGWGWSGMAEPGERPRVHTSSLAASEDPAFTPTLSTGARAAMVHLRWATSGMAANDDNAHPFLADDISFEHNGSLKPVERVRAMLSERSVAALHGQTDSEMYFALVRERYEANGRSDLPGATVDAVRQLRDAFPLASLNALLLDRDELIVVHASARSALSSDDLQQLRSVDLPDGHEEDYFALRWQTRADGTVLVASTGVAGHDWASIPPECVMTVALADGRSTVTPLPAR